MEPGSLTIAAKSWTPSLPSLKRTRSRKAPSFSRRKTLVSIETCNPFRLLTRAGAAPIFAQPILPRQRPFLNKTRRCLRKHTFDELDGFDRDERFVFAVDRMEMRRRVIPNIHPDCDAIKPSDGRHRVLRPSSNFSPRMHSTIRPLGEGVPIGGTLVLLSTLAMVTLEIRC